MATSFLSSADKSWFDDSVDVWFETFKSIITIHKEPLKTISVLNNPNYGYEENTNLEQVEYTPRYGSYYAVVKYENPNDLENVPDIKTRFTNQIISIQVKQNARDYIKNDNTLKIEFQGKSFNIISNDVVRKYFDKIYYVFYLEETK
jgi:hypothetical protein